MLNEITRSKVVTREVVPEHKEEIEALAESLGLRLASEARIAPSIITRGEILVFGRSSPRFAYRLYFDHTPGFINIRRLDQLEHFEIAQEQQRNEQEERFEDLCPSEVVAILKNPRQSCVADCLLPTPKYLGWPRFHISRAKLSAAYGESSKNKQIGLEDYEATPYVKNITLGGGLCTQASCFMAAAILHKHSHGVHGLAEITSLAHSPRRRLLSISGMHDRLMSRYFKTVGLRQTEQQAHAEVTSGTVSNDQMIMREFETGMKAYALSDMPIVFPCDVGRLLGFDSLLSGAKPDPEGSVYAQNGCYPLDDDLAEFVHTQANRHCFVIVGCETKAQPGQSVFVFNDPGAHPFMWAKTDQLARAGTYKAGEKHQVESCRFWSVTPEAVRMPLLDYRPIGAYEFRRGLKWLSYWYRKDSFRYPPSTNENFLLVQLKDLASIRFLEPLPHGNKSMRAIWKRVRIELDIVGKKLVANSSWLPAHWVWLEIMEDAVWIWDAETEPLCEPEPECLVAKLSLLADEWKIIWPDGFEID